MTPFSLLSAPKVNSLCLFVVHYMWNRKPCGSYIGFLGISRFTHFSLARVDIKPGESPLRAAERRLRADSKRNCARLFFFLPPLCNANRNLSCVLLAVVWGRIVLLTDSRHLPPSVPRCCYYHALPKPLAMPSWRRNLTFCLQKTHDEGKSRGFQASPQHAQVCVAGISVASWRCVSARVRKSVFPQWKRFPRVWKELTKCAFVLSAAKDLTPMRWLNGGANSSRCWFGSMKCKPLHVLRLQ